MGGVPYKKRLMVTKSIRISEELLKRIEAQLWNEDMQSIPHGRQVEFFAKAVICELERLEGRNVSSAITELDCAYIELASSGRVPEEQLFVIEQTLTILKKYKSSKGEGIATI